MATNFLIALGTALGSASLILIVLRFGLKLFASDKLNETIPNPPKQPIEVREFETTLESLGAPTRRFPTATQYALYSLHGPLRRIVIDSATSTDPSVLPTTQFLHTIGELARNRDLEKEKKE